MNKRPDTVVVSRPDLMRLLDTVAEHYPMDAPADYVREWVRCWQDTYLATLRDGPGSRTVNLGTSIKDE